MYPVFVLMNYGMKQYYPLSNDSGDFIQCNDHAYFINTKIRIFVTIVITYNWSSLSVKHNC